MPSRTARYFDLAQKRVKRERCHAIVIGGPDTKKSAWENNLLALNCKTHYEHHDFEFRECR